MTQFYVLKLKRIDAYWSGKGKTAVTEDLTEALQFRRLQDAEKVLNLFVVPASNFSIVIRREKGVSK